MSHVIGRPRLPRIAVLIKRCSKCQTVQPADQFPRSSKAPDGRQYWCRSCFRRVLSERSA